MNNMGVNTGVTMFFSKFSSDDMWPNQNVSMMDLMPMLFIKALQRLPALKCEGLTWQMFHVLVTFYKIVDIGLGPSVLYSLSQIMIGGFWPSDKCKFRRIETFDLLGNIKFLLEFFFTFFY